MMGMISLDVLKWEMLTAVRVGFMDETPRWLLNTLPVQNSGFFTR